jgi:hypothetical protein
VFGGTGAGIDDKDNDDKCKGTLRWDVKVASDEAAEEIKQKPKVITLAELVQYRTDTLPKGNARAYSEKFTYTLKDVFITHAILEDDNDLHLVIEDGQHNTLIAEIPDVNCKITEDSRFATQINQHTFDQYQFDITGVFFKDKSHGQTGRAPNNVELHPVTALKKIRKINAN